MFCQTMAEHHFAELDVIVMNQVQDKKVAISGKLSSLKKT